MTAPPDLEVAAGLFEVFDRRLDGLLARLDFDPSEPRDESGKWTDGGGGAAALKTGMKPAEPEAFVKARDRSTRQQFLSAHPASELADHTLFTNEEGTVGISVDPKGDIQNVFNNGGPKGGASKAMVAAIAAGGRTLDCYDGFLPAYYSQFGFAEDQRMKFNRDFAPPGWDFAKAGTPDIVFMSWRGYMGDGGAQGALNSAASHRKPPPPERSEVYGDDWDAAKERSRTAAAAADSGRTRSDSVAGIGRAEADGAGDQRGSGAGAGAGRNLGLRADDDPTDSDLTVAADAISGMMARLDAWDESSHPRGQPDNKGQFVTKGGETAGGLTIQKTGQGMYDARVNGDYAGHAHVAEGHPFLSSMHVHEDHAGKGIGAALHDHVEKELGRPLVPNPLHMTDEHKEMWQKRLAEMPPTDAAARLTEARKIGSDKFGRKQTDIDKLHNNLRAVVGGMQHPGEGYSAQSYIDALGRIHTSNVQDAARALYEKKSVVLSQPRQVSTLIEHLGKVAAEFIRLGGKAPTFDLCKVSVEGTNLFCAESKGIPRVQMPQLDKEATKRFRKYLEAKGFKITREKEKASYLRATQDELNGAKVAANAASYDKGKEPRRIIVSRDNYILDGHHKWAAMLGIDSRDGKFGDKDMKVSRVDASITELLAETQAFGATTGASVESGTPGGAQPAARTDEGLTFDIPDLRGRVRPLQFMRTDAYNPNEARIPKGEPGGGQWTSGGGGLGFTKNESKSGPSYTIWNHDEGNLSVQTATGKWRWSGKEGGDIETTYGDDEESLNKFINAHKDALKVKPHDINMEVADVGGDEWNKATGKRMEFEYVKAAHHLDKLVRDKVASGEVDPAPAPEKDEDEEPPENEYGYSYPPDDWDMLSGEHQSDAEKQWIENNKSDYVESEEQNWHENGDAKAQAASQLADDITNGNPGGEFFEDATEEWVKEWNEEHPDDPVRYTPHDLFMSTVVEDGSKYKDWGAGSSNAGQPDISFTDDMLDKPLGYEPPDPAQMNLPGVPEHIPPKPGQFFTDDQKASLTAHLEKAFDDEADKQEYNLEAPDYISEQAEEQMGEVWDQMDDKQKFKIAKDVLTSGIFEEPGPAQQDEEVDEDSDAIIAEPPKHYDPLNTGHDMTDYRRTQALARTVSIDRGVELLMERGVLKTGKPHTWQDTAKILKDGERFTPQQIADAVGRNANPELAEQQGEHGLAMQLRLTKELANTSVALGLAMTPYAVALQLDGPGKTKLSRDFAAKVVNAMKPNIEGEGENTYLNGVGFDEEKLKESLGRPGAREYFDAVKDDIGAKLNAYLNDRHHELAAKGAQYNLGREHTIGDTLAKFTEAQAKWDAESLGKLIDQGTPSTSVSPDLQEAARYAYTLYSSGPVEDIAYKAKGYPNPKPMPTEAKRASAMYAGKLAMALRMRRGVDDKPTEVTFDQPTLDKEMHDPWERDYFQQNKEKLVQAASQYLYDRHNALAEDTGKGVADLRAAVKRRDREMWEAWKGSSTSTLGKLIQIGSADELGGRVRMPQRVKLDFDEDKVEMPNFGEVLAANAVPAATLPGGHVVNVKAALTEQLSNNVMDLPVADRMTLNDKFVKLSKEQGHPYEKLDWSLTTAELVGHAKLSYNPEKGPTTGGLVIKVNEDDLSPPAKFLWQSRRPEIKTAMLKGMLSEANAVHRDRVTVAKRAAILKAGGYKPLPLSSTLDAAKSGVGSATSRIRNQLDDVLRGIPEIKPDYAHDISTKLGDPSSWSTAVKIGDDDKFHFDGDKVIANFLARNPNYNPETNPATGPVREAMTTSLNALKERKAEIEKALQTGMQVYQSVREDNAKSAAEQKYLDANQYAWEPKEELIATADKTLKDIGGYAGLKALLRAKWETTQWLLDKAGIHTVKVYRGMEIPSLDNTREKAVIGKSGHDYKSLPEANIIRPGAHSTSLDAKVSNGWRGNNRIVLRMEVPRTAVLSIPAYGINVHGEHELVVTGTAWKNWDAWRTTAPTFDQIPIASHVHKPEGVPATPTESQ
jgi:GNAT superfamily N-acetyltransferase